MFFKSILWVFQRISPCYFRFWPFYSRQQKAADFGTTSSWGGGKFPPPKVMLENPEKVSGHDKKNFGRPLESKQRETEIISQNANFYMSAIKFFWSNFAMHWHSETIKNCQISVFPSYVWYSTTNTERAKHFYFIQNRKYGLFLNFRAPSQLHRTKSRFCGSSQSFHIFTFSSKFIYMHQIGSNWYFLADFARSHRSEILS